MLWVLYRKKSGNQTENSLFLGGRNKFNGQSNLSYIGLLVLPVGGRPLHINVSEISVGSHALFFCIIKQPTVDFGKILISPAIIYTYTLRLVKDLYVFAAALLFHRII